ncbi:hypothetical protein LEP1GSC130_3293 [Leptospira santarosai str. 200403458]|nr:hypothetical protein LEP1GSC130_3293 [Leptospira santarosai str. 200403458]
MHQNGQDKLFHILKRNGLLLEKPRKHSKTTNSNHSFFKTSQFNPESNSSRKQI